MKRFFGVFVVVVLFVAGCGKQHVDRITVSTIGDLTTLQYVIAQVSEDLSQQKLVVEDAQILLNQLQDRYFELTNIPQSSIEQDLVVLQQSIRNQSPGLYALPLRAKKVWMTYPQGIHLDTLLSKYYTTDDGYESVVLVYTWSYADALKEAETIAQNANLHVSKTFLEGQAAAQNKQLTYISGLDIEVLKHGVVYVNHDLLDKNVEMFLSVSVEYDGTLVIEATKYK